MSANPATNDEARLMFNRACASLIGGEAEPWQEIATALGEKRDAERERDRLTGRVASVWWALSSAADQIVRIASDAKQKAGGAASYEAGRAWREVRDETSKVATNLKHTVEQLQE